MNMQLYLALWLTVGVVCVCVCVRACVRVCGADHPLPVMGGKRPCMVCQCVYGSLRAFILFMLTL